MAFQNKNLSVIAYANGFTLWQYASNEDSLTKIINDNYFKNVRLLMNKIGRAHV